MTPQQSEVADAIAAGIARRDLAAYLRISREAVDGRLHHMRRAFGVDTYEQLCDLLRVRRPHANHTIEAARKKPRQWFNV